MSFAPQVNHNPMRINITRPALTGPEKLWLGATIYKESQGHICEGTIGLFWPSRFGQMYECIHPDAREIQDARHRVTPSSGCQAYLCDYCMASISKEATLAVEVAAFLHEYLPDAESLSTAPSSIMRLALSRPEGLTVVGIAHWHYLERVLQEISAESPETHEAFRILQVTGQELGIWPVRSFADKVKVEGVKAADPAHAILLYGTGSADESLTKAVGRGLWDIRVLEDAWPEFRELRELARKSHLHHKHVPERVRELQKIVLPKLAVLKALYGPEEKNDE